MTRTLHPEWRDENEGVKYPFSDIATLTNSAGDFIPETLFLDAAMYPIGATERMYLSGVTVTGEKATIKIGDENSDLIASVEFSTLSPPDVLQLKDTSDRPAGALVSESNRLATFQSWTIGEHVFLVEETEFAARVCAPTPEIGFRGFILEDGSVFTDDIWIIGDDGVVVRHEELVEPTDDFEQQLQLISAIRVDVVGDPLFRRRLCGNVFTTPQLLKQITVKAGSDSFICTPNEFGDFQISMGDQEASDSILRIRSLPDGLTIETVGEQIAR